MQKDELNSKKEQQKQRKLQKAIAMLPEPSFNLSLIHI